MSLLIYTSDQRVCKHIFVPLEERMAIELPELPKGVAHGSSTNKQPPAQTPLCRLPAYEDVELLKQDPLSYLGAHYIPSTFRRNLHYGVICSISYILCHYGMKLFPTDSDIQYVNYLTPVIALVLAMPTFGAVVTLLIGNIYMTLITGANIASLLCDSYIHGFCSSGRL